MRGYNEKVFYAESNESGSKIFMLELHASNH